MVVSGNAIGEGIGGSGFKDSIEWFSEAFSEYNKGSPSMSNICSKTERFGIGEGKLETSGWRTGMYERGPITMFGT
jgi:hypothetical protein